MTKKQALRLLNAIWDHAHATELLTQDPVANKEQFLKSSLEITREFKRATGWKPVAIGEGVGSWDVKKVPVKRRR